MHETEIVLWLLLMAVVGLITLAGVVRIPYPIFLVLGGVVLALIPSVPTVVLQPNLVLLILLPPVLYSAAFFSSLRELRDNLRPIAALSIGLVLATMVVVAVVAHAVIDSLTWPAAFVLGAIVSPTDAVAATAIARRLGVPRRIVTIVEGESLINDATALIAYKFAVAAVVTGSFSAGEAGMRFVGNAAAGVAIGLAVGWIVAQVRRRLDNPPVEITISVCTPYFAYLPADVLGVSAVLAAVTTGIYMGWRSTELIMPSTRIQAYSFWEVLVFLVNSALFVLVGLQLRTIVDGLGGESAGTLAAWAALTLGLVVGVRLVWVMGYQWLPRVLNPLRSHDDDQPPWTHAFLVGFTGMRGAVTLAAALALPRVTDAGDPFPGRNLIIFLAFAVVLGTVVGQGLTLPLLIRFLGVEADGADERREAKARLKAAMAALSRIEELADEEWVRDDTAQRMRGLYEYRRDRFVARFDDGDDGGYEERSAQYQRLRRELLEAERRKVYDLRRQGFINDDVMHRIERDLDLEDARLET